MPGSCRNARSSCEPWAHLTGWAIEGRKTVNEFEQRAGETPLSWLKRLGALDTKELKLIERRALGAYLAEARRLLQEEQQRARWRQA